VPNSGAPSNAAKSFWLFHVQTFQNAVFHPADNPVRPRPTFLPGAFPSLKDLVDISFPITDGNDLAVRQLPRHLLRAQITLHPTKAFLGFDGPVPACGGLPESFLLPRHDRGLQYSQRQARFTDGIERVHEKSLAGDIVERATSRHRLHVREVQFRGVLNDQHARFGGRAPQEHLLVRGDQKAWGRLGVIQQTIRSHRLRPPTASRRDARAWRLKESPRHLPNAGIAPAVAECNVEKFVFNTVRHEQIGGAKKHRPFTVLLDNINCTSYLYRNICDRVVYKPQG